MDARTRLEEARAIAVERAYLWWRLTQLSSIWSSRNSARRLAFFSSRWKQLSRPLAALAYDDRLLAALG